MQVLKRKIKDQRGAVSIFFLFILPVTVLALLAAFANTEADRNELDFIRSCESELDLTLADYDRQLWQEFGLWGTPIDKLNQYGDHMTSSYIKAEARSSREIQASRKLEEDDQLRQQILRHMSVRGPLGLLEEVNHRMGLYQTLGTSLQNQGVQDKVNQSTGLKTIIEKPEDYAGDVSDLAEENPNIEEEIEEAREATEEDDSVSDQTWAMSALNDLLDDTKEMLVPVYQSLGTGGQEGQDPTDPSAINGLFASLDHIFFSYDVPALSKLQIQEYMLRYYTMHCSDVELNGQKIILTRPDGTRHKTMLDQGREHEVEQVVFNDFNPDSAYSKAKWSIYGIIFAHHLVKNFSDQEKLNSYRTIASILSGTVAVLSLGTIIIEPEVLVYGIAVVKSIVNANSDQAKVQLGKSMLFQLGDQEIEIHYKDFMRIFSLLVPEEKLLQGLTKIRQNTLPGPYGVAFVLNAHYNKSQIQLTRAFSDFVAEGEGH